VAEWLGPLDEPALSYRWAHADARMDALQREVAALVERCAAEQRPTAETFDAVRALAERRLGRLAPVGAPAHASQRVSAQRQRPIPHLTEAWFC
jgi:hypothetical protein